MNYSFQRTRGLSDILMVFRFAIRFKPCASVKIKFNNIRGLFTELPCAAETEYLEYILGAIASRATVPNPFFDRLVIRV